MRNAEISITRNRMAGKKFWLAFCLALTLLCDLVVFVALLWSGAGFSTPATAVYWSALLVLLVSDAAILAVAIVSNLRFRYARRLPYAVLGVTLAAVAVLFALHIAAYFGIADMAWEEVLPLSSSALWLGMRLLACVALFAAVGHTPGGKRRLSAFTAVAGVLLFIFAGGFSYFTLSRGFFGQGGGEGLYLYEERPVVFVRNASGNGYCAIRAESGRGGSVRVPSEFNGLPVTAVGCDLLSDPTISIVNLDCSPSVNWIGWEEAELSEDVTIYAPRENFDSFRENLYLLAMREKENASRPVAIADRFRPVLEEDEVSVQFSYDAEGLEFVGGRTMGVWIAKRGTVFSLDGYEKDFDYVSHWDSSSEANCYWSYEHTAGYILSSLNTKEGPVVGARIEESVVANAVFEQVYRVEVGSDNDTKYESAQSYKEYDGTGARYLVASTANAALQAFPKRAGFTLGWQYSASGAGKKTLQDGDLASVLKGGEGDVTVYPLWTLEPITITTISDKPGNAATYGDDVVFTGHASHDAQGITYYTSWNYGSATLKQETATGNGAALSWTRSRILPTQAGSYVFRVRVGEDELTSLSAETSQTVRVTVAKKTVALEWTLPSDTEYSASDKTASIRTDDATVLSGDEIELRLSKDSTAATGSSVTLRDAGRYTLRASLGGTWGDFYTIQTSDVSRTVQITPHALHVTWSDTETTYNGEMQKPTATVTLLSGDTEEDATLTITSFRDAGDYTARATFANENYTLENATESFKIAKKTIQAVWSEETTFTYDGGLHGAKVLSLTGLVEGDGEDALANLTYSGDARDARTLPYETTAVLGARTGGAESNYSLENATHSFTINPKQVTLNWGNSDTKTYDGTAWKLSATTEDFVGTDKTFPPMQYSYTQGEEDTVDAPTDVGSYTAKATLTSENYTFAPGTDTHQYSITRRAVPVVWGSTSFIYDHTSRKPTATAQGVSRDGTLTLEVSVTEESAVNKGSYHATAALSEGDAKNYELSGSNETQFTIEAKQVTLSWQQASYTFNAQAQKPTATADGFIAEDEGNKELVYSYEKREGGTDDCINAGDYTAKATLANDNYELQSATFEFTITPKTVLLTWQQASYTYNAQAQKPTASTEDFVAEDGGNKTLVYNYTKQGVEDECKNAGEYSVTATLENSNYRLQNNTFSFTIEAKALPLTWTGGPYTYNATAQKPTASSDAFADGEVGSKEFVYTYTKQGVVNDCISAGQYSVTATIENSNYRLENSTHAFTIAPAPLTIKGTEVSAEYDGTTHVGSFGYTHEGLQGGDSIGEVLTVGYEGRATEQIDVTSQMSYTPKEQTRGTKFSNYVITFVQDSGKLTITPKSITVTWGSLTFTYDGTAHVPTAEQLQGVPRDGMLTFEIEITEGEAKNAGTYHAKAYAQSSNGDRTENYTITNEEQEFKVEKAKLTLRWKEVPPFEADASKEDIEAAVQVEEVQGAAEGDAEDILSSLVYGEAETGEGQHSRTAALSEDWTQNYELTEGSGSCSYEVRGEAV